MHELVPETPLRHGHAISIDMAYSATLANSRKLITDAEHRRILNLFSRAGLSMDHHMFDEEILDKGTAAILKTRDGKLRAAVPNPIGSCTFLNDVSFEELNAALQRHKLLMREYPRCGEGLEAYVDASDTGYTDNTKTEEEALKEASEHAGALNGNGLVHEGSAKQVTNGTNGTNGKTGKNGIHGTNGTNGIDYAKVTNGTRNGVDSINDKVANGHAAGFTNGTNGSTDGA